MGADPRAGGRVPSAAAFPARDGAGDLYAVGTAAGGIRGGIRSAGAGKRAGELGGGFVALSHTAFWNLSLAVWERKPETRRQRTESQRQEADLKVAATKSKRRWRAPDRVGTGSARRYAKLEKLGEERLLRGPILWRESEGPELGAARVKFKSDFVQGR